MIVLGVDGRRKKSLLNNSVGEVYYSGANVSLDELMAMEDLGST